jgi:energy-coupling factor transport system substrate-specific component
MNANKKNYFKFSVALILCLLVRLIPFRAPNIEPILATMMPMSRAYGVFAGFSFAVLSILFYDTLTGTLGIQTFFTTLSYGILGLWAGRYFSAKGGSTSGGKKNALNTWSYVRFAIIGTLFFDALTGLSVGPIFFHQTFMGSLVGQIPFTALHLLGNITFALILSPAVYKFLIKKREKETAVNINIFNPKTI